MCRLLAVRSATAVPMARLLIGGDNSFAIQSLGQLDGWGIAHYADGQPQITRGVLPAICDEEFERLSLRVASSTVIAHIRRGTSGPPRPENCHPFRYGRWVFAHNGFVRNYAAIRDAMLELVDESLRPCIRGDTDTEVLFHAVLSRLRERVDLDDPEPPERAVTDAMARTLSQIRALADVGPSRVPHQPSASYFNSVLSNGRLLLGTCWGRPLSFRWADGPRGRVVTLSTESIGMHTALEAENTWIKLRDGDYVFVDGAVQISTGVLAP